MITIGGVELGGTARSIQWVDRFSESSVVADTRRFLSGNLRVLQAPTSAGRRITLDSAQNQGWLSLDQVTALQGLSEVLGATYTLDFDGELYEIVFDHSEGAAVDYVPLIYKPSYVSGDYFTGTIHLLTV